MPKHLLAVLTFGALACGSLAVSPARAQTLLYHVSMGTSGLAASPSAPFSLDFQFNDGGTPGNNTVTLNNFTYGGGSASASPSSTSGGATGSATSTITLTDTGFINELVQAFTPGTALAFDLRTTTNLNTAPGSSPDEFSFALLDKNGNEIVTTAPDSAFVTVDLASSRPMVTTAGTPAGASPAIAAPQVQAVVVPEAGSLAWLMSLTGAFVASVRSRRIPATR